MEKYSFFNAELVNGEYDRTYLAEDYARYFASFIGNGVYPNPANNLQVTSNNTDMKITVGSGKAWINGYFYDNNSSIIFTLDNADGVLNRIDSVVVRLDLVNRNIKATIKNGTFAINPQAPELIRNDDVFEIQLATVYVGAGVIKISQSNVTDTRQDSGLCGVVSGVVDQIDTTGLFAQYNNAFSNWFETIKNQLGQDIAGNLLDNIEAHKFDTSLHVTSEDKNSWNSKADGATVTSHTGNTTIHVTASDKTNWNSKAAGTHNHDGVYSATSHSHSLLTYTVTHSKSGTVHTLTGLPTAAGIYIAQFKATANFDVGNTFAGSYTAKPMGEETALPDKAFITGDLVSVVVDVSGKKLGFRLGGASTPKFPTYTGSHALFGTDRKGYIEIYSSGTLTAQANMNVEAFLVGGGGGGASNLYDGSKNYGGGGGGGGYTKLISGLALISKTNYPIVIGAGAAAQTTPQSSGVKGGDTTAFAQTASGGLGGGYSGGNGGSGGGGGGKQQTATVQGAAGGSNGSNGASSATSGGVGQGTTTIFNNKTYSGGGGGGAFSSLGGAGGTGGGGRGGGTDGIQTAGQANTGGGGGGSSGSVSPFHGEAGGSGIVIIRWGY